MLCLAGCGQTPATADPRAVAALDAAPLPGPSTVGWTALDLDGLPILLFYPATGGGDGARAPLSDALSRRFGAGAAADLAAARGPAGHDARPLVADYPLILFAPGAGLGSNDYRWLLAGLASRGALVAGLDPDGSPPANEDRVVAIRAALVHAAQHAAPFARFGRVTRIDLAGHSLGGAGAVAALGSVPRARAVDIDGDFLGIARAPAAGAALLISGRNPTEPARAETRRSADWALVSNGRGRRLILPDMRHLGATDASLLPDDRRKQELGPAPAATHRAIGDAMAAFLLEGR